jgi:hypothetical protein
MGNSDAPGYYFFAGLALAGGGLAAFALGSVVWGVFLLVAAAALVGWSKVAVGDGFGNRCTACGQEYPARPWSL